jgi:hypothetical protein
MRLTWSTIDMAAAACCSSTPRLRTTSSAKALGAAALLCWELGGGFLDVF